MPKKLVLLVVLLCCLLHSSSSFASVVEAYGTEISMTTNKRHYTEDELIFVSFQATTIDPNSRVDKVTIEIISAPFLTVFMQGKQNMPMTGENHANADFPVFTAHSADFKTRGNETPPLTGDNFLWIVLAFALSTLGLIGIAIKGKKGMRWFSLLCCILLCTMCVPVQAVGNNPASPPQHQSEDLGIYLQETIYIENKPAILRVELLFSFKEEVKPVPAVRNNEISQKDESYVGGTQKTNALHTPLRKKNQQDEQTPREGVFMQNTQEKQTKKEK